ncbi:MAG TPA: hypothetical protein VF105_02705 [Gemmatimonadaceae bacterium]
MTRGGLWMIPVLAVCATACDRDELTNNDRRVIHAWLTCDDCTGQRASVSAIGEPAVDELDKALVGPGNEQRTIMDRKFGTSFRIAEIRTRVPTLDSAEYTTFRNANYVATYQKRAATSLADIGSDASRSALDRAIADSAARRYRSDVMRVIRFSRGRIGAMTYGGKIAPFRTQFADTVKISPPTGSHFTGSERVIIEDSLFPPGDIPSAVDSNAIKFLAVAPAGLHMVDVVRPGAPIDKIPMLVTSLDDVSDRSAKTCSATNVPCMIDNAPPIIAGHTGSPPAFPVVFSGTPADSLDFFRIPNLSAAAAQVTAALDWRGDGRVDLAWRDCTTYAQIGQTAHGTPNKTVQLSGQLPGNGCLTLQVSIADGKGPAYGKLVVSQ